MTERHFRVKAAVIIPARYSSTRFPGKALVSIGSKPVIEWIYDAAKMSVNTDNVVVATDEQKIYDTVRGFGGNVIMTSASLRTGSDRCAEVTDNLNYALYFSRSPIPHIRDRKDNSIFTPKTYYKHLGIYAYRRDFIMLFSSLPTSNLEELEKLEQLRVLECGYRIKLKETVHKSFRIDTPEDLKKLEEGLNHGQ